MLTGLTSKSLLFFQEFDLITADGVINCEYSPYSQENLVTKLMYTEVFVALRLLQKGGSLVLKVFSIFECHTLNLIYLLNCCFQKVYLFKPMSCRDATSELFVVCLCNKFGAKDVRHQQYLIELQKKHKANESNEDVTMFPLTSIPSAFLSELTGNMEFFVNLQMAAIESNIAAYPKTRNQAECDKRQLIQRYLSREYLERYPISELALEHRVVEKIESYYESFPLNRGFKGSYSDEKAKKGMTQTQLLAYYRGQFPRIRDSFNWQKHFQSPSYNISDAFKASHSVQNILALDCLTTRGKRFDRVLCTRFMNNVLFDYFLDLIELVQLDSVVSMQSETNLDGPNTLELIFQIEIVLENLLRHERDVIETILESFEKPSINNLVLTNVLVVGQKVVGLLYLIARVMAGSPDSGIFLQSSGQIWIRNINAVRNQLLELQPVFDVFHDNGDDQVIWGVVDMKKMRTNPEFFKAINMFNNTICVRFIEYIIFPSRK